MSDAGYTLAETLVALVMVGLAIGGLTVATEQFGRLQARAGRDARAAAGDGRLSQALGRLFDGEGPFTSGSGSAFTGDTAQFSFPCGDRSCGGELVRARDGVNLVLRPRRGPAAVFPLGPSRAVAFEYGDAVAQRDAWPPTDARAPETLRSVALMRTTLGEAHALAQARIWIEQPAVCAYDPISRACRAGSAP